MYIAFDFPKDESVIWAFNNKLNHELQAWSEQYGIHYNTKIHKQVKRITFDNKETYSFFAMTWTGPEYRLVEPMNVDRS
jgi:hypothetical protein